MFKSVTVPALADVVSHIQLPAGIEALANVVVLAPDVLVVALSEENTAVGEAAFLVLAYLIFHVTDGVELPVNTSFI